MMRQAVYVVSSLFTFFLSAVAFSSELQIVHDRDGKDVQITTEFDCTIAGDSETKIKFQTGFYTIDGGLYSELLFLERHPLNIDEQAYTPIAADVELSSYLFYVDDRPSLIIDFTLDSQPARLGLVEKSRRLEDGAFVYEGAYRVNYRNGIGYERVRCIYFEDLR